MLAGSPLKRGARDVLASLVVFLVALPLCMGIAVASGFPPFAGLVTGFVGGALVGLISGSPFQVSGPAAGLAVIVLDLSVRFGLATTAAITLLAGLIQMAAGFLRVGQWFRAVSPSVIYGMLAGIGVLILGSQVQVMIGAKAGVGVMALLSIFAWNRWKPNVLKAVPGALIGVLVGSFVAAYLGGPSSGIAFVEVPLDVAGALAPLGRSDLFAAMGRPEIWVDAAGVALIASMETLLCATAVDQMHSGPKTHYDRELFAQGVGNTICGALGAIPMTGVIVRSSANVSAGAATRASTVLHGIWILLFVAFLPGILRQVPLSVLAAVLVHAGLKLLDLKAIRELMRHGRWEVIIYGVTLFAIVSTDLLGGVLVGFGLALFRLLRSVVQLETRLSVSEDATTLELAGVATFINLPKLAKALDQVPRDRPYRLKVDRLRYVDHACSKLIRSWEKETDDRKAQSLAS